MNLTTAIQVASIAGGITAVSGFIFARWSERRNRFETSVRDRRAFNSEFRKWADQVIMATSKAMHQWCRQEKITTDLLAEISALLNMGRLFLLNEPRSSEESEIFNDRENYRGKRPRMLDCVMYFYRFIKRDNNGRNLERDFEILFALQAVFVCDTQVLMALDHPESTMEQLHSLLRSPKFLETTQSHQAIQAAKDAMDPAANSNGVL